MLVAAVILVPALLLAAGARAHNPRAGRALVILGIAWLACLAAFVVLALPIGGSVEGGVTDVTPVQTP
jgi:hypothetical protein